MAGLILFLIIILLPIIWMIATYNTLVALRNHISESWSDVDTELQRRYELIPNLVEAVKAMPGMSAKRWKKSSNSETSVRRIAEVCSISQARRINWSAGSNV